MKVKIGKIRKTLQDILIRKGLSKEIAEVVADEYLDGELRGRFSHGLMAFPSLAEKITKAKPFKIVKRTHSMVLIEGNKNPGVYVGKKASDMAISMAKKEGVGIALIKNMLTWLRPGTIAKYIADKGYIAFVTNSSGHAIVAPPGGYEPVIGTNAVGIGIPTGTNPIIADMALSVKAWGEVRKAQISGEKLPGNAFYNFKGEITSNAKEAYSALSAGSYKGFAFGLLSEILTGSMLGREMSLYNKPGEYRVATRGAFILVINPGLTSNIQKFYQNNSKLVKDIKKTRKLKGVKEIYFPGEQSERIKNDNIKKGYLEINNNLWNQIQKL